MVIRVRCVKGWDELISPDRIVVEMGWDRWVLTSAGRSFMTPDEEKARNAGLVPQ